MFLEGFVLARTPPGDLYLYMIPEVIQKAYLTSVIFGKTWDAETFWRTFLTGELYVRLYRKIECFGNYCPWPERAPSSIETP